MNYDKLIAKLRGRRPEDVAEDAADAIRTLQAELADAKAVIEKLPKTADGVTITPGMEVWWPVDEDIDYWNVQDVGDAISATVTSITFVQSFSEYRGECTIGTEEMEAGNLDLFSTRAAAEAAKEQSE